MKLINILRKKQFPARDIILFKSDANYTHVYFESGKRLTIAKTLKALEPKALEAGFIRTHKSFIINPYHIKDYLEVEAEIHLSKDLTALVSRRRKEYFENCL